MYKRGLLCCRLTLNRAMREASRRRTATIQIPALFLYQHLTANEGMTAAQERDMKYTLTFKHRGKSYSNHEVVPEKFHENQYEAVACGLLLGEIEQHNLSRNDKYVDLCLIEYGETEGSAKPIWGASLYIPTSEEVK